LLCNGYDDTEKSPPYFHTVGALKSRESVPDVSMLAVTDLITTLALPSMIGGSAA
jgi:hypothetical protein